MPVILLIAFCLVVQLIAYIYLDRKKLPGWKYVFLILLLFLNCFIFPGFYYPEISPEEGGQCALIFVSIDITFILFGNSAAILLHLIYWLIRKLARRRNN